MPRKIPTRKPTTAPKTERQRRDREATDLLRRAGFEHPAELPLLSASGAFTPIPISPADRREDGLIVRADPAPAVRPPEEERILWRGIGPNGKPCVIVEEGEARSHWIYEVRRKQEPASRAREWIFEGPESQIRKLERRLLLTRTYFALWLQDTKPAARSVERSAEIAERYIAEASGFLVYRGRNLSPDAYGDFLASARYRQIQVDAGIEEGTPSAPNRRPAVTTTAAAFRVTPAVVRRVRRDLERFLESGLYREKSARYDALSRDTHLL